MVWKLATSALKHSSPSPLVRPWHLSSRPLSQSPFMPQSWTEGPCATSEFCHQNDWASAIWSPPLSWNLDVWEVSFTQWTGTMPEGLGMMKQEDRRNLGPSVTLRSQPDHLPPQHCPLRENTLLPYLNLCSFASLCFGNFICILTLTKGTCEDSRKKTLPLRFNKFSKF